MKRDMNYKNNGIDNGSKYDFYLKAYRFATCAIFYNFILYNKRTACHDSDSDNISLPVFFASRQNTQIYYMLGLAMYAYRLAACGNMGSDRPSKQQG